MTLANRPMATVPMPHVGGMCANINVMIKNQANRLYDTEKIACNFRDECLAILLPINVV